MPSKPTVWPKVVIEVLRLLDLEVEHLCIANDISYEQLVEFQLSIRRDRSTLQFVTVAPTFGINACFRAQHKGLKANPARFGDSIRGVVTNEMTTSEGSGQGLL